MKNTRLNIKANVREFIIPPIRDSLVIGRNAPIGSVAITKSLELLHVAPFENVELDDDVVGDIIVRKVILKRIPRDTLVEFVLNRIKPLMGEDEIMQVDISAELFLEEEQP